MSGESAHPTLGPVRGLKHPRDGYRFEGGRKAATLREPINNEVPVDLLEFNSGLPEIVRLHVIFKACVNERSNSLCFCGERMRYKVRDGGENGFPLDRLKTLRPVSH
jgi:hypothetical protein